MNTMFFATLLVLTPTVLSANSAQKLTTTGETNDVVMLGVPYKWPVPGAPPLEMDLLMPNRPETMTKKLMPAILYFQDGGWAHGSRFSWSQITGNPGDPRLRVVNSEARKKGIALIGVTYRLAAQPGQYGADNVRWPAQIEDALDSVRFIRKHSSAFGVDPDRIGCWGRGGGGQLCAMLGALGSSCEDTAVQAAVAFYAPTDLIALRHDVLRNWGRAFWDMHAQGTWNWLQDILLTKARPYLSEDINGPDVLINSGPDIAKYAKSASAASYVSEKSAPLFLAHGTADNVIPVSQADRLLSAYEAVKRPAVAYCIEGAAHVALPPDAYDEAAVWILDVLDGSEMRHQGVVQKHNGDKQCTCPCGSSSEAWMCKDSKTATWDCPIAHDHSAVPSRIPLTCPMFGVNRTEQRPPLLNAHHSWRSWSSSWHPSSVWNSSSGLHSSTSWHLSSGWHHSSGWNMGDLVGTPLWFFLIIVGSLALIFCLAWLATRTSAGGPETNEGHIQMSQTSRQRVIHLGQHDGRREWHQLHNQHLPQGGHPALPQRGHSASSSFRVHPAVMRGYS